VTELVIEAPDLQSSMQRMCTGVLLGLGWLLWVYFTFPFLELCGWFMDIRICSEWVNLSGGYMSLQHLLGLYALTAVGWLGLWSLWGVCREFVMQPQQGFFPAVALESLCHNFLVEPEHVLKCRSSRVATVYFDCEGQIVGMEAMLKGEGIAKSYPFEAARSVSGQRGLAAISSGSD